ncbi:hypothetical protein ACFC5T_40210 [Streptomyces sp. NPDC055961]|uniref:hypothetical protein n=1 Tax=Streptomyces sp. NPDC055961 TaxID=3345666 RepID=UPI0035E27307
MRSHERSARRAKATLAGIGLLAAGAVAAGAVAAVSVLGSDDKAPPAAAKPTTKAPARPSNGLWNKNMTPAKAKPIRLVAPTGQANGISTGFPHNATGAVSMAVYFTEEYALLDDQKAHQQLEAAVSPDAPGYVDEKVSEVRKLREGVGLPPSGGNPAGLTFTTSVKAVRARTIRADGVPLGDIVHVWLFYDRYATGPDGGPDKNPLKDEATDVIVKWQDGAWKLTNEPALWAKRSFPVAYDPDSPYAWQDGWVQVLHEG